MQHRQAATCPTNTNASPPQPLIPMPMCTTPSTQAMRCHPPTLMPRAASSQGTGSKVRLTLQWSRLSLPWMTKKRVWEEGSSAMNHSAGDWHSLARAPPGRLQAGRGGAGRGGWASEAAARGRTQLRQAEAGWGSSSAAAAAVQALIPRPVSPICPLPPCTPLRPAAHLTPQVDSRAADTVATVAMAELCPTAAALCSC